MSFTGRVKDELIESYYTPLEDNVLISGFLRSVATISSDIRVISENLNVLNYVKSIIFREYDVEAKINDTLKSNFKHSSYEFIIDSKIDILKDKLMLDQEIKDYFIDSDDLKRAYLRGVFLAVGSVNDPKTSRYHLEFLLDSYSNSLFLCNLLNYFYLNAKVITREKGYMVYVKEAEKIGDFLRLLNCNRAVMYYEDIRIYRDHKNMTNRLNNCEQANVDKIISTCKRQLDDIDLIIEKLGMDFLDEKLQEVVIYRKKYPESSLEELSEIMSIETEKSITKSGLNHRFRKLRELANKIKEEK